MEKTIQVSNETDIESNQNVWSDVPHIDPVVEKSLVRRMDLILLPTLSLVYLTHSLDRANLGNAKSATLEQDLGLVGNQYSLLLIVFYIPYSLFGIPATVLAKRYSSALVIPLLSAISGLISWGVFQWHRSLKGWQYLFLIEGAISVGIAFIALMALPHSVQESRWFTATQKQCASLRLEYNPEMEFNLRDGFIVLKDWKIWTFALCGLLYGVGSSSTSNFLPVMIKRLTQDTVRANLYTIGPNLTGALMMYISCWVSDRIQQRALVSIVVIVVSMIGWILLGALDLVHHVKVGYFLTYLLTFGTFVPMLLVPAWVGANTQSTSARAVALGFISMCTNLGGIVSSGAYRAQDAPTYRPALITVFVCQAVFVVICAGMRMVYARMNRDLARGNRVVVEGVEVKEEFRFML
ncbi:Major facilitator superfamily domain, general substrate transporter [Penicillium occitanis (nom. inval.)]|nr:hypothetical protein PENOC_112090 [Penicillium occitanis (nom. inval.)]PCG88284.1 Major facilitator superfamily domain, general substrate transporter [Penicillium occitanis (nom. inval.)]